MENVMISQDEELLVLEVTSEDEAREKAAAFWGVSGDEVDLNVVEEGGNFLGLFGKKKLKVEARPRYPQSLRDFVKLLKSVLKAAQLELEVLIQSDGNINLSGIDSRILLGGHRGEGLKALDYLVNLMARNNGPVPRVRIDCEGYRCKREKELKRIAMQAAKDAMKTRRTVYLQPMSAWERRIVHLTLKESIQVETHSIGSEPHRKVAVRLVGSSDGEKRSSNNTSRRRSRGGRPGRRRPRHKGQSSGTPRKNESDG